MFIPSLSLLEDVEVLRARSLNRGRSKELLADSAIQNVVRLNDRVVDLDRVDWLLLLATLCHPLQKEVRRKNRRVVLVQHRALPRHRWKVLQIGQQEHLLLQLVVSLVLLDHVIRLYQRVEGALNFLLSMFLWRLFDRLLLEILLLVFMEAR